MTQKIEVDFGLCESNGVCMGIIPEVFDLDDQDYLHILQDDANIARVLLLPCRDIRASTSPSTAVRGPYPRLELTVKDGGEV